MFLEKCKINLFYRDLQIGLNYILLKLKGQLETLVGDAKGKWIIFLYLTCEVAAPSRDGK